MNRILILIISLIIGCDTQDELIVLNGRTMGTTYSIKLIPNNNLSNLKMEIDSLLYRIDKIEMSTWAPKSVLSQFNQLKSTEPFIVPRSLFDVVSKSIEFSRISNGAFDVTVMPLVNIWGFGWKGKPKSEIKQKTLDSVFTFVGFEKIKLINNEMIQKDNPNVQIDLSAIAKGYGVDQVAFLLDKYNIRNYLVEIGGEVRAKGKNQNNEFWKIGIDRPNLDLNRPKEFQEIISISDWSVATSGDYRNYYIKDGKKLSHSINPKTRHPVDHELGSVTIIAKDCMTADALATACLVLGAQKAIELINTLPNVEAMLVERDSKDNSYVEIFSTGFEKFLYKQK